MRTETQKAAFYKSLAVDYTNQSIALRCKASVHLENRDDERFWNTLLQTYSPGSYNYIYSSQNAEGNQTSGCIQCLQFADYLSDRFFICIDSDYRYLRQENVLNNHYVLQTYTYSWENHYCHAMHLQSALSEIAPDKTFDFNTFLNRYSCIVYKPLLVYLYMDREKLKGFGQRNFNDMMALQYQTGDLENNGGNMLSRFESKVETFLFSLGEIEGFDYEEAKSHCENLNVNEANAYLHVRGHNLYHMVLSIGNHLSSRFEETLLKDIDTIGYWEIEQCRDDIMAI